jgi:hypothetical protein
MINQKLVKRINKLADFKNKGEVLEFEELIYQIARDEKIEYLPFLFSLMKDNDTYGEEITDNVMRAIEMFPNEIYVKYLLINLRKELTRIPDCCEIFFHHLLNADNDKIFLKQNIHLADKDTMLKLLDNMENDKYCPEEHKPIIKELRELVKG